MPGFSNILGQEAVKDHLKKAIEYHKVSHAYILTGEKGRVAKMVLCGRRKRRQRGE